MCKSDLMPRLFTIEKWWTVYGYVKEVLTRVLPIVLLIISNIVLIYIVRSSRKKMQESVNISYSSRASKNLDKKFFTISCFCIKSKNENMNKNNLKDSTNRLLSTTAKPPPSKRNRQENQLTWMTIFVAILYTDSSIPMVFAYPGIIGTAAQTQRKMYTSGEPKAAREMWRDVMEALHLGPAFQPCQTINYE